MVCSRLIALCKCVRTSAVLLCLGCLVACGGNVKDAPETAPVEPVDQAAEGEVFVPIPNPYLAQTVKAPDAAKKLFAQAQNKMNQKDWSAAHAILQSMTDKYPTLSGPFVNKGITEWRMGSLEQAEQSFQTAIDKNPLNNDAYNQAALLKREQGKFAESESLYLKSLEVWPHSFQSHRNLGILYDLYMGKFDLAMKHYEMAEKLAEEDNREIKGWIIDLKRRMAN